MNYNAWIDYALAEYDVVKRNYNQKIYENVVKNPKTDRMELMQMTLREVLEICADTNYEERIKRAVMKCVYTNEKLETEIRREMDLFFEVS